MKRILFTLAVTFAVATLPSPLEACPVVEDTPAISAAHGPMLAALSLRDLAITAPDVAAAPPTTDAPPALPAIDTDPEGFARTVWGAFRGGQWVLGVALVLIAAVWLLRRPIVTSKLPMLGTRRGGAVLAFLGAFLTVLVFKVRTGAATSPQMLLAVFALAWTAVGGWNWLRDVLPEMWKTWLAKSLGVVFGVKEKV